MDSLPVIELSMKPTSLCDRDSQVATYFHGTGIQIMPWVKACMHVSLFGLI